MPMKLGIIISLLRLLWASKEVMDVNVSPTFWMWVNLCWYNKTSLPRISGQPFFPGIWGIILLSAKYFILSILDGSCSIMGYTLYWSFKQNTINRIWSSGWLTGIKKINFHKTIPRGLSEACQNASPPWTRAERLWLLWLPVSPLNEFVQPPLPSSCFPPFRSHISQEGASLLNCSFYLAGDQLANQVLEQTRLRP